MEGSTSSLGGAIQSLENLKAGKNVEGHTIDALQRALADVSKLSPEQMSEVLGESNSKLQVSEMTSKQLERILEMLSSKQNTPRLSPEQIEKILTLQQLLNVIQAPYNQAIFVDEGIAEIQELGNEEEWKRFQELALELLKELNIPVVSKEELRARVESMIIDEMSDVDKVQMKWNEFTTLMGKIFPQRD